MKITLTQFRPNTDLYTSQERYFSPQDRSQLHLRFPSHQQDQSNLKCLQEEEGDNRLTP